MNTGKKLALAFAAACLFVSTSGCQVPDSAAASKTIASPKNLRGPSHIKDDLGERIIFPEKESYAEKIGPYSALLFSCRNGLVVSHAVRVLDPIEGVVWGKGITWLPVPQPAGDKNLLQTVPVRALPKDSQARHYKICKHDRLV